MDDCQRCNSLRSCCLQRGGVESYPQPWIPAFAGMTNAVLPVGSLFSRG